MRSILLLPIAMLLSSCVTPIQPTPYQPNGFGGGFTETQLDTNVFKVTFRGNGVTHADRAEDMALLRSADLTLQHGFTHFAIIDSKDREKHVGFTTPTQSLTSFNATAYGNTAYGTAHTTNYGGQTFHISKPSTTNTIMCFNGKPDINGLVYDARFICNSLGSKYEVACSSH